MRKMIAAVFGAVLVLTMAATVGAQEVTCDHSYDSGSVRQEASCSQEGQRVYTCTLCGHEKTDAIARKAHTYGVPVRADDVGHKMVCTGCGNEASEAHSWDAGTVVKEPGCTTSGEKKHTCVCGAEKTAAVEASGHSYSSWSGDSKSHSRTCSACGHAESGNHKWDSGTVTQKAWCTREGIRRYTCTQCGMELLNAIPALTHAYENDCDPGCDRCGATRKASHKYATSLSKDQTGHWYACTVCGDKKDFTEHSPGAEATEKSDQICLTCSYVIAPRVNHVHEYDKKWSSDIAGHWYQCKGCGHEDQFAAHTFLNSCATDCFACGYQREASHSFDGTWLSDDKNHWYICSACGKETNHEPHVADVHAAEGEGSWCRSCGYVLEDAEEHTHSFGPQWQQDADNHWQECQCGEVAVPRGHEWDSGRKMTDGTIRVTCTVCGATDEVQAEAGFPWGILIFVLLMLTSGAGAAYYFLIYRKRFSGKYV